MRLPHWLVPSEPVSSRRRADRWSGRGTARGFAGGRPRTFNLPERREIKKIAKSKPVEHGLPFSTWSLSKLADFLVAEGVVDDISHEGLRVLLREEGVSFQRIKIWKTSKDPDYAAKKARVEQLYAIADGEVISEPGEPTVVFCLDEFGPLNLMPHPGRHWAVISGKNTDPDREPRPRRRATEAQFTALRYFALDGTDHRSHREQGGMSRRYIAWRNRNADDRELRRIVNRASAA